MAARKRKSARKSRAKPFSVPSWYAKLSPYERAFKTAQLREKVKTLRHYSDRFSPAAGYNMRDVRELSASRIASIDRHYADLQMRLMTPHVSFVARNKKLVRAIQRHAPQKFPKQFRYLIPVDDPAHTVVERARGGTFRIVRTLADGSKVTDQYFYLPRKRYVRTPHGRVRTFDNVIDELRDMLPNMPEGRYGIIMDQHGLVGDTAGDKASLLALMRIWDRDYSNVTGKERTPTAIVGFQYLGTMERADSIMDARRKQRRDLQRNVRNERERARRRLSKRARVTGRE